MFMHLLAAASYLKNFIHKQHRPATIEHKLGHHRRLVIPVHIKHESTHAGRRK